jgi:hypothetical protein
MTGMTARASGTFMTGMTARASEIFMTGMTARASGTFMTGMTNRAERRSTAPAITGPYNGQRFKTGVSILAAPSSSACRRTSKPGLCRM